MKRSGRSLSTDGDRAVVMVGPLWLRAPTVPVLPGGILLVTAGPAEPAHISARRFARSFTGPPIGRAEPGSTVSVVVPADQSSIPWNFEVNGAGARAWVCSAS